MVKCFFIDIVGFTSKSEQMSSDIEGIAEKLRNVMDIAREIIVENHQGIVDKFMGDAVMGWIGGHFSTHWNQLSDSRRQLFQDEIEDLERNIANLQRTFPQHQQIHQNKSAEQKSSNPSTQLKALKDELESFKDKLEANIVANPLLLDFHEKQMHNYKKTLFGQLCHVVWRSANEFLNKKTLLTSLELRLELLQVMY